MKMKLSALAKSALVAVLVCCVPLAASAQSEVRITRVTEEIAQGNLKVNAAWPRITGIGDAKAQENLNIVLAEKAQTLILTAKAAAVTGDPVDGVIDFETARNNGGFASIKTIQYLFTGGANGTTTEKGYTFRTADGKLLTLSDLFKQNVNYQSIISVECERRIREMGLEDKMIEPFTGIASNQGYFLTEDALVIIIPEITLFPHVMGVVELEIPAQRLRSILLPDVFPIG